MDLQLSQNPDLANVLAELTAEVRALRQQVKTLEGRALAPASVSVEEAAHQLQCSQRQVYRLIRTGKLRAAPRAGRKSMVSVRTLEAFSAEVPCAQVPCEVPEAPRRATQARTGAEIAAAVKKVRV